MGSGFQESQIMICLICRQSETAAGRTSVNFERGEFRLQVNNVPARVCPACGEAYVDEEIAVQLLKSVEEIYRTGMRENVIDYPGVSV
jgi:YgiT-type zinc finger domain-containing protein